MAYCREVYYHSPSLIWQVDIDIERLHGFLDRNEEIGMSLLQTSRNETPAPYLSLESYEKNVDALLLSCEEIYNVASVLRQVI